MALTPRRLFVYGTLMPGQPLWPELAPFAESIARGVAEGILWDTGLGYPAATFGGGIRLIPGVVITLRAESCAKAMTALDEIEGEGVLYRRVEVATSEGQAMAYEWLGEIGRFAPLPDGWCPPTASPAETLTKSPKVAATFELGPGTTMSTVQTRKRVAGLHGLVLPR